jgi:hypothetical protein
MKERKEKSRELWRESWAPTSLRTLFLK